MLEADRILDLGPGAGEHGGRIVCYGTPAEVMAHPESSTGAWLAGRRSLPPLRASAGLLAPDRSSAERIALYGASEHNLKRLDIEIPLRRLVCLTGVSGSGKSTLVQNVLYPALQKAHGKPSDTPGAFERLEGAELIDAAVMIDQTPIGRTTRSNPASYVGAFDEIRARFAAEPEARLRRYTAGRSASIPAPAAAPRAAATASSTSRCSFSPTCTCVAANATAAAIVPRHCRFA